MTQVTTGSTSSTGIFGRLTVAGGIGMASVLAMALAASAQGAATAAAAGTWLTEDGDARITITECEAGKSDLCGTIVGLKYPTDPKTGKPPTDKNNPDVAKRNQPMVGLQIVRAMKPSGKPGNWKGEVYNPNDGRVYSANLIMQSADKVRLEGCMLFICSGETWTRTQPAAADLQLKSATGATAKPGTSLAKPTTTGSTR